MQTLPEILTARIFKHFAWDIQVHLSLVGPPKIKKVHLNLLQSNKPHIQRKYYRRCGFPVNQKIRYEVRSKKTRVKKAYDIDAIVEHYES